eukprot:13076316-Alexandrium_andersonii.AAC.1
MPRVRRQCGMEAYLDMSDEAARFNPQAIATRGGVSCAGRHGVSSSTRASGALFRDALHPPWLGQERSRKFVSVYRTLVTAHVPGRVYSSPPPQTRNSCSTTR